MTKNKNLKTLAQQLLASAGLPYEDVIREVLYPKHFGDGEVTFKVGPMHLRFVRERGQDFLDVSPASVPGKYHPFADVELAMGWKAVGDVWSRVEPEPLPAVMERLRNRYPQFEAAFSSTNVRDTLAKLDFASRRRGADFVDHLRRLAEDARRK
jgi:hypothetical protein